MFYKIAFGIVKGLMYLLNGKPQIENKDKLPTGNYIMAGPHKTWWDPLYFAIAGQPKEFAFMAKKELFKNRFFAWVLDHVNVFGVDRDNPGPSAIKIPVRYLTKTDLGLIMFPSGTRHSDDLKGGIALIAKMAKVPIVPAVYVGPTSFKGLLKRQKVRVIFGDPIDISDLKRMSPENIKEVENRMNQAFLQIKTENKISE